MNNTEKKLDALIDALGFDVEVTSHTVYGESIALGSMPINCGGTKWEYFADKEIYTEVISTTDYKLTKKVRHYELTKPMIENIIGVLEGHDNDDVHILINNLEVMINENI